jgi:hypothetical protein
MEGVGAYGGMDGSVASTWSGGLRAAWICNDVNEIPKADHETHRLVMPRLLLFTIKELDTF